MKLSASQAAKQTGKSVPTITRAIKSGKLSAEKLPDGGYHIDPAELFRVFPAVTRNDNTTPQMSHNETLLFNGGLQAEIEILREKLRASETERDRERGQLTDQIEDLRRRLDGESEERRKLTALLTHDRPQERAKGWWPFGGRR